MMQLMGEEYDPLTGRTQEYWYDHEKEQIIIRHTVDVGELIGFNKDEMNMHGTRANYSDSDGLHKVATIPVILVDKWKAEQGFDWYNSTDKERRAWLDKPEHAFLKTRPGKLSGTSGRNLTAKVVS